MSRPSKTRLAAGFILGALLPSASPPARAGSAADFLNLDESARAAGLGGAYAAAAEDADALLWNPAALTHMPAFSAVLSQTPYLESSRRQFGAFGVNAGAGGAWAVGVQSLSYGEIAKTDEFGDPAGAAAPQDLALSMGHARSFRRFGGFSLGLAGRLVRTQVADSARTGSLDLGLLSRGYGNNRVRFALTALHLGGRIRYGRAAEPLPSVVRAGASAAVAARWRVSLDGALPRDEDPFLAAGAEYRLPVRGGNTAFLRAGHNTRGRAGGGDALDGVTAGLGWDWHGLRLDYAYRLAAGEWAAHQLGLAFRFGADARDPCPPEVRSYVSRGRRLLARGQLPEAVLEFNEALSRDPACRAAKDGIRRASQNPRAAGLSSDEK